ncbi:MAG: hypothetical protein ABSA92_16140 [Candidatus Bathyarchaeia archaeon]
MDIEKFAEEAFKRDSRIRYVGIVDRSYHVLYSKMRPGEKSIITDERDRNFFQLTPPIFIEAVEKLEPFLGKLDNVTVRYEKQLLVFFRCKTLTVVFKFNPDVSTGFISTLSGMVQSISTYLE